MDGTQVATPPTQCTSWSGGHEGFSPHLSCAWMGRCSQRLILLHEEGNLLISCSINHHVESVSSPLIPPTVPPEQNEVYRPDPEQWLRVLLLNSGLPVTTNSALDGSLHSLQSGVRGRLNSPLHFPIMMTNDPSITCLASGTARSVQVEWATCATGNVAPSVASAGER